MVVWLLCLSEVLVDHETATKLYYNTKLLKMKMYHNSTTVTS